MLKYLRIAVTALSRTACVLSNALWVRSYSFLEQAAEVRFHALGEDGRVVSAFQ